MRKPYYRSDRQAWFVKVNGGNSQVRLHEDEQEAYRIWREMCAAENPDAATMLFVAVADKYIVHAKKSLAKKTYRGHQDYLVGACHAFGNVRVADLKKFHITEWLDSNETWGDWARRAAAGSVKRAINWAVEEGYIKQNPLAKLGLPKGKRREQLIDDEMHAKMMRAVDAGRLPGQRIKDLDRPPVSREACFRAVLIALRHSGTRPGMVASVTVEDVTQFVDAWILHEHKSRKKSDKPLIVRLSPCLQTLTRIAMHGRESGPLFLNSRGVAWTPNAIRCRMKNLKIKLGLPAKVVAYSYRHSFTTTALLNGVDLATVATLLGHKDFRMIAQHYSHLERQADHLTQAVAKAIRKNA